VGAVFGLIFIFVIIMVVKGAAAGGSLGSYDSLVAKGIPARGILLQVSSTGTKIGSVSRRFELRQVYIDVEIPGKAPYEISATPVIPINLVRDVLPGATVELRVDPRNPSKMAIIGPGTGFVQQALRTS
jgi:hypothetical protein